MYALAVAGFTWQFGPLALAISGLVGISAVAFLFERVEARGETVQDAVSQRELFTALERDLTL
jgi:hypothetical protein